MRYTMGSGRSPIGRPNFFGDSYVSVVVIRDAQEMYLLALVTQKGGRGKSTLAVRIAVAELGSTADLLRPQSDATAGLPLE